jgi:hypothetical protein
MNLSLVLAVSLIFAAAAIVASSHVLVGEESLPVSLR